jgi:hypothetical protein
LLISAVTGVGLNKLVTRIADCLKAREPQQA